MMTRFFQALRMTVAAAAILGGSALQGAVRRSEQLEIPFDFKVQGKQLPAGTYRLQQSGTDRFATLVNLRTGKRVQMLGPMGNEHGNIKLVFEHQADGYVLKKLS